MGAISRPGAVGRNVPLVGSEVCQYENTSDGDFLIDHHPKGAATTRALAIGSAAAGIALLVLSGRGTEDPSSLALRDWSRIASGRFHLEMRSTSPAAVSRFFVERGLHFRVGPETLVLPGFRLSGARVHAIGGRTSALVVHRDARNKIVVCQRFEGRLEELPRPDRILFRDAVKVHLYRSRRGSAAFWQDGAVIRSLASDLSEEELVRLALSRTSSAAP